MEKEQQLFKAGSILESQKSPKAFLGILWMWSDLGDWSKITEISPTSSRRDSLLFFPKSSSNPLYWHCSRISWICGWGTTSAGAPLRLRCCWGAPLVKSPTSGSTTCQSRTPPALCCEDSDIKRHNSHILYHLKPCCTKQILKPFVNLLHYVRWALKRSEKILGMADQKEAIWFFGGVEERSSMPQLF